ncbi:MAG: MBL fold metallo-hydrolase [Candidatus Paceibacterota bacterium]
MIITYHGLEQFKVQFGDVTLGFNPVSKESKVKSNKFGADVGLLTINHPDMNGGELLAYGERKPFLITGPGEYEVKDVFIKGFPATSSYGGTESINTIYRVTLEGMNLTFLGALSSPDVSGETREAIQDTNILFVPIGGGEVLDPENAYKLAVKFQPNIIIPMHFSDTKSPELKAFLKEGGSEDAEMVDKYTVKKKDLDLSEGKIVVITPSL